MISIWNRTKEAVFLQGDGIGFLIQPWSPLHGTKRNLHCHVLWLFELYDNGL